MRIDRFLVLAAGAILVVGASRGDAQAASGPAIELGTPRVTVDGQGGAGKKQDLAQAHAKVEAMLQAQAIVLNARGGCPVHVSAERQGRAMVWRAIDYAQPDELGGDVVKRGGAGRIPPTGQGLELTLGGLPGRSVVGATVIVHGWSGAGQMLLGAATLDAGPRGRSEVAKSFHLKAGAGESLAQARLWTSGMTAVSWVEVTELSYSDGSAWRSGDGEHCRVTPSAFMLVIAETSGR